MRPSIILGRFIRLRRILCWLAGFLGAVALAWPGMADVTATESELKAAFLYNFARFIHWPDEVLKSSNSFAICTLGKDPLEPALAATIAGKKIDNLPLVVRVVDTSSIRGCRILFFGSTHVDQIDALLGEVRGEAILTVADSEKFAVRGGMIGFRVEGSRMHLDVNVNAAEAERLRISSQLLKLARIVPVEGERQ